MKNNFIFSGVLTNIKIFITISTIIASIPTNNNFKHSHNQYILYLLIFIILSVLLEKSNITTIIILVIIYLENI